MKRSHILVVLVLVSIIPVLGNTEANPILVQEWWNAPLEVIIDARDRLNRAIVDKGGEAVVTNSVQPVQNLNAKEMQSVISSTTNGLEYEVTHEYKWNTGNYDYWALVIKNKSNETCDYSILAMLYDENNNLIGAKNLDVEACPSGYEGAAYTVNDSAFAKVEYTVTPSVSRMKEVHSFVNIIGQKAGNKAIMTATNNGAVPAKFVEYIVFFLKNGQPVWMDWGYLTDDDNELKPGRTEMREAECYNGDFDTVEIYFDGRQ